MGQDRFFAIFSNGEYTSVHSLESLPKNDHVVMYIHGHFNHEHITQGGTCISWYQFEIIDKIGQAQNYKLGNFEVIKIHPDNGLFRFLGRQIDILDNRLGTIHHYLMSRGTADTIIREFYHELIDFMQQLNTAGSWQAFREISDLKAENEQLKRILKKQ